MKKERKGIFITLEGIDGCGKSTQAKLLAEYLERELGKGSVCRTFEPGDWSGGHLVRELLLSGELYHPRSDIFLFFYDRCEHVKRILLPELESGKIVVCERFYHSTLAYQSYGGDFPEDLLAKMNEALFFPEPDLIFLLDIPVNIAMQRLGARSKLDRFEKLGAPFFKKVRDGFLAMSRESKRDNWRIIDAGAAVNEVHSQIIGFLNRKVSGVKDEN